MTCHDALKLAEAKGLERHVAELTRLCGEATIVGIVEGCRARVDRHLTDARSEVQVLVARSTAS
jgi:hypothetical protein